MQSQYLNDAGPYEREGIADQLAAAIERAPAGLGTPVALLHTNNPANRSSAARRGPLSGDTTIYRKDDHQ